MSAAGWARSLPCLAIAGIVAAALLAPSAALAQRRAAAKAPAPTAPRVVGGHLRADVIKVRDARDTELFDFKVESARVVDGKVELVGKLTSRNRSVTGTARVIGSVATRRAAEDDEGRARRATERAAGGNAAGKQLAQQPGGAATTGETASTIGQLAQATQSTARTTDTPAGEGGDKMKQKSAGTAAATGISGCEMIFLDMAVPPGVPAVAGSRSLQVSVSVATFDNARGEEINRRICRVVRALADGDAGAEVAALNLLLAGR